MTTKEIWHALDYGDVYALCRDGSIITIGHISDARYITVPILTKYIAIISLEIGKESIALCHPRDYTICVRRLMQGIRREDIKTLHIRHQNWILEKLASFTEYDLKDVAIGEKILDVLGNSVMTWDELREALGLSLAELTSEICQLELVGKVRVLYGKRIQNSDL